MDPPQPLSSIDPFSRSVVHLTVYFNESQESSDQRQHLATGTGIIRQVKGRQFLITAGHNLTGRSPENGTAISPTGGIPNEILGEGYFTHFSRRLYDGDNNPNDTDSCPPLYWLHPQGASFDVAVLPLTGAGKRVCEVPWDESFFNVRGNQLVRISVADTCLVIGYPLGLVDRQDRHLVLPIYKTANIASEPHLDFQGKPILVIDATTREGMSGSPVIVRKLHFNQFQNRFLGIYTGRFPRLGKDDDPALGIVYKPRMIQEIFAAKGL
jgi:hypothetical protein